MSKPCIVRPSEQEAVDRGAGLESFPLLGARTGALGFSNGITVFEPGAAVPLHTHNVEESITMLEGEKRCARWTGSSTPCGPTTRCMPPPGWCIVFATRAAR